ncbi:LOW QUALITY PROTEIN: nuclear exosome regulator NRDE2 [Notolabrus celidotus]|uniref:LOW QUALITY PROTEIN: nuclear exosome regulator NRDE2 n=1 Tax=Notolabrus celidotus TaxID=1203425 RepID=UPI00148F4F3A|nr:LOW QUALITY PROTEIN: nuclear exosome regulator NRDE2 [Notolabrus celidotus]
MALFPAFAGEATNKDEDLSKELDWLKNKSFQTSEALTLHNRFVEKTSERQNQKESSVGRDVSSAEQEEEEESNVPPKKKKKKSEKKKKKKKKHKKKSGRYSGSSGSDSDTVYPSDLKREEEEDCPKPTPLASCFSWLDDLQTPTGQAFCVDRKADPANWTYKSLYRGDVARYRRKGSSSLGLNSHRQGVSWEESESNKKQKGGDKKKGADRYFSTVSRQLLRSEPPVPAIPTVPECSDGISAIPFLPLCEEKKGGQTGDRVQTSSVNPLGVYDSSTALWLQGKGLQDQTEQQKEDTQKEKGEVLLAGRTEDFNRRLREQPADTQLWIEFIRYQDELTATAFGGEEEQQGSDVAERRKSSYRAVLEKKLSIAERAVAVNPSCVDLQLERLRICKELWEPSLLAKEWKKLVFLHPNSTSLWKKYLLFTQSYFSNFSVSKVNSAYGKCLSTLSAVRDGSMVSHTAQPGIEEDMLDILTLQCHFLRQAGHCEKAISLFQAMMDFTFYKPDSVQKLSTKQQVEFFEPFWDSGEARVGEVGARGWKAWMQQQERGGWLQPNAEEDEEEEEEEEEVKDRSQPRWTVWLDVETSREAAHWLPWRPDKTKGQSEEDCEDPDRQVLFDDIGSSLICLSSPELQLRLLLRFFSFLGLPVDSVLSDAPCQPGLLLENLSVLTQGNELCHPLTSSNLPDLGVNSVGHMTTLQGTRKWIGLGKLGEKFVTYVFSMIQPVVPAQHRAVLSLSWMQYEKLKVLRCLRCSNKKRLRSQGKSSKRIAKQLLKESDNRSSLVLWREYGHLESMLGNLDEARKVFSTASALGGAKGLRSASLCELCLLWAQLEVENKEGSPGGGLSDVTTSLAVCVLTRLAAEGASSSSSSSESLSPVSILKARRTYEQTLTAVLSGLDQNTQNLEANRKEEDLLGEKLRLRGLVGCYALFQYLTMGIQAANLVYSQAIERMEELHRTLKLGHEKTELPSQSAGDSSHTNRRCVNRLASECEEIAVQQAALLRYHNSINVFPLATLRQMLTSSLSTWSSSAPLWRIYIQVENRYHSAGRARRFFHSVTRNNCKVLPRLFSVVAEQQRKLLVDAAQRSCCHDAALPILPENGLSNRIHGLFENAIATELGSHCPLLWRMYMNFLASEGRVDKAKGIFYKALQNIPWAKGLYMDAVQLFPVHLQEFVDLMTEKELRLRLPLEELDILLED